MSSVLYRSMHHSYPEAARAEGMFIFDRDGRQYLDMSGGAAVSCLGHGHPEVIDAITRQLRSVAFAHTAFFTTRAQEALAERLARRWDDDGARCYFLSGGSEANETALKLVWQYWQAMGQGQRKIIISRQQSYHGNTFGALMVSGNSGRRLASGAPLPEWPRIAPFYPYRGQGEGEDLEQYARRVAGELEQAIVDTGPDRVAGFICEPVVGSSLGVVPAEAGYLQHIREICDRYGILWIADEIMCGSGRTGTFFAHQYDGVRPDLVTLAKGIAGGYQPLAAVLASKRVVAGLAAGGFAHGHTYVGHPVACAAGLAVQDVIDRDHLLDRTVKLGADFGRRLQAAFGSHPLVGQIRGRGLFWAMEFVSDRSSRAGFSAGKGLADELRLAAMAKGLVCYPMGIEVDGGFVPHIMLAPPMIVEPHHMDQCIEALGTVIAGVLEPLSEKPAAA